MAIPLPLPFALPHIEGEPSPPPPSPVSITAIAAAIAQHVGVFNARASFSAASTIASSGRVIPLPIMPVSATLAARGGLTGTLLRSVSLLPGAGATVVAKTEPRAVAHLSPRADILQHVRAALLARIDMQASASALHATTNSIARRALLHARTAVAASALANIGGGAIFLAARMASMGSGAATARLVRLITASSHGVVSNAAALKPRLAVSARLAAPLAGSARSASRTALRGVALATIAPAAAVTPRLSIGSSLAATIAGRSGLFLVPPKPVFIQLGEAIRSGVRITSSSGEVQPLTRRAGIKFLHPESTIMQK